MLQFKRDTIDQSPQLAETLFNRFGRDGELEFSRRVFFGQASAARRRRIDAVASTTSFGTPNLSDYG